MISSMEQARRRRQLNQRIRDLIAVRRAAGHAGAAQPAESTDDDGGDPALSAA
jgi:hypothetical protein